MNRAWVLLITILFCLSFGLFPVIGVNKILTSKDKLIKEDFMVVGLELGRPISKVIDLLGKPAKSIVNKDIISYEYSNLIVKSFPMDNPMNSSTKIKNIDYILVKNNKLKTFRAISINDGIDKVYERYGKTRINDDSLIYETYIDNLIHAISFTISNNKVSKIEIYIAED